jgi:hypothetical protein
MADLLYLLRAERATLAKKLARVDGAIHALNGNVATLTTTGVKAKKRTWTMSAAARKKISLAQKKRWAKVKR